MNQVILIGRLTKDPDLRYTPNGAAVCTFTLAVNRPFSNQDGKKEADFINIVVWNKIGENCAKYLAKGKQCAVDGRLQIRSYTDENDNRHWITEVVAAHVEFLGSGKAKEQSGDEFGIEIGFDDSDIPFN